MKAISIKEPYASLIHSGRKTIETRTWKTDYRGPLLLCASKKPEWIEEVPGWIRRRSLLNGMAFATCELLDIRPMTKEDEQFACCSVYHNAYSWILDKIIPINPRFNVTGRLGLFEVDFTEKYQQKLLELELIKRRVKCFENQVIIEGQK